MNALAEATTGSEENEPQQETKLFEMPAIDIDDSNPSAIHVVVAGSIPLDRSQKADVDWFNGLEHGKLVTVKTTFFVKGSKKVHRRDGDGNPDAIVETKSLVVDGVQIVED